jgi:hypothetical protein
VLFVAPEAQVGLVVVRMEGVHVLFFLEITIIKEVTFCLWFLSRVVGEIRV